MLVFVYGTLKIGEPNHSLIQEQTHGQCVLKGKGVTVEKYPLVIATYCNVPFLLYKPGIGHNIEGEIYEVDTDCLADLDKLEHHPEFYERKPIQIRPCSDHQSDVQEQRVISCDTYFIVQFRERLLELPMISCYTDNMCGMKFIMPVSRRSDSLPLYEVHKGYEKSSSDS